MLNPEVEHINVDGPTLDAEGYLTVTATLAIRNWRHPDAVVKLRVEQAIQERHGDAATVREFRLGLENLRRSMEKEGFENVDLTPISEAIEQHKNAG